MRILKSFLPILILSLAFVSCSKERVDTEAPEFTSVLVNGESRAVTVQAGSDLMMTISAKDNENVSQIKIDIHEAFDGHEHGKVEVNPWTYVKILSVSGSAVTATDRPTIPIDVAAGPYHAVFRVLDDNGNEGAFIERTVVIQNGSQPIVSVTSPVDEDEFQLGQTITPIGSVTDVEGLEEVHLILLHIEQDEHGDGQDHGHAHEVDEDEMAFTDDPTTFDLSNMSVTIPAGEEAGHYLLVVKAVDVEGNHTIEEIELDVIE
ncbi:MAG: DUF4625 domain-containing protein [Flavobacteriia bacterium]|nr:DUF4625 domain-containing protein [Flavobacteriia bacterium]